MVLARSPELARMLLRTVAAMGATRAVRVTPLMADVYAPAVAAVAAIAVLLLTP